MRMYHVNSADKKALVEVWHHPHIFNKERGRFLKCSGKVPDAYCGHSWC